MEKPPPMMMMMNWSGSEQRKHDSKMLHKETTKNVDMQAVEGLGRADGLRNDKWLFGLKYGDHGRFQTTYEP